MDRIRLQNATIVPLDPDAPPYLQGDVTISKGKIESLNAPPSGQYDRVIDASRWILLPGLVNAHTHTPMTLLRGLKDDCPLDEWLRDYIWPAESSLTPEDYYYGSLLGLAELIATGTTSVSDMYRSSSSLIRAAVSCGIKANLCESITCDDTFDPASHPGFQESVRTVKDWNGYDQGRIRCDTSIQSCWQTTPALWRAVSEFASESQIGIHIHLSETKEELDYCREHYHASPVQALAQAGVFSNRVIGVHGVFLSPEDLEILSAHRACLVHDPCSNLKCCCGFAQLQPCLQHGIPVALGTDGVCSNNSGDLFDTIKLTGLLQKMLTEDPSFLSAQQLLVMATQNGLLSQGRQGEAGMIRVGMDADLIAVSTEYPSMQPLLSPISSLAYAATGSMVKLTMVRGKILYENGVFHTIDLDRVLYHVNQITSRFR